MTAPVQEMEPPQVTHREAVEEAVQVAQDIQGTMGQETAAYQYPPLSLLTEALARSGERRWPS